MRKIQCLIGVLATIVLLQSTVIAQQPIRWEPTLDSAQRLAGQTNRLVLIQFWAPWCTVCRRVETEVFSQTSVAADIAVNYVPVKVNADHFPATAKKYGVTALPTTVITTPQGQQLDSIRGRLETAEFMARLNRVATAEKNRGSTPYAQIPANAAPPATAAVTGPTSNSAMSLSQGAQPPMAGSQPPAASPAPVESRYADFIRRPQNPNQNVPPTPIAQPSSAPVGPTAVQPPANNALPTPTAASAAQAYPPIQQQTTPSPAAPYQPLAASPSVGQRQELPATQATNPILPSPTATPTPQQPPTINSPLGLDGYCPVTLTEKVQWAPGDRRWGAIHRGRTYLFAGPEQQRRFFTDPDRYAPAVSGNDVVLATEQGQPVPGMREHGVFFGNRVFLFSSEATLERFARNPAQYATQALGAVRTGANTGQIR